MDQPNILFIVSDQERQRDWLPDGVSLPARERLITSGLELRRHYTHSSPCSPSRATLMTGRYVPQHGVNENVGSEQFTELDRAMPTLGRLLAAEGYQSSYIGKWHLSHDFSPDLTDYGYDDWEGNDRAFMGWAGTGYEYDPPIADDAVRWLSEHGDQADPWFLTVALVNPHDVMWFPIDQPDYQAEHREETELVRSLLSSVNWKEGEVLPAFPLEFDRWFDTLPANFDDDLHTKPAVHRQWIHEQQHTLYGTIDPTDTEAWLRHLDYYVKLHQLGDENLARILAALDATGQADDTIVVFTSDHGDMCGSHGLRSKGPWNYEEIMRIPAYVVAPGLVEPGSRTESLTSSVDLAATIAALGGVDLNDAPTLSGRDLAPLFTDQQASVRDHILFAQDSAWYGSCIPLRYASRGYFDGRTKYCRYYGVGGSVDPMRGPARRPKLFDVDAAFEDHDHEWYDLQEDPDELVNLAMDRGRRDELRGRFDDLLGLEHEEFTAPG